MEMPPHGVPLRPMPVVSSWSSDSATSGYPKQSTAWMSPRFGMGNFFRMWTSSGTWPLNTGASNQSGATQTGGIGGGRDELNSPGVSSTSGQHRGFFHTW